MTIEKQWKAITVVAITIVIGVFLFFYHGFLSWSARVGHNQSGVGINGLMLAVTQYAEDHKGILPPMKDKVLFRHALWPYTKSESTFFALDGRAFLPNPQLSGKPISGFKQPTIVLYEATPCPADGSRWVAFIPQNSVQPLFDDPGFAGLKLVKEAEWHRMEAANGIP